MKKLQKVISGGQTGVDQAALRAAMELDYRIGGWCPPGRVCEDGKIPPEYPLNETKSERSSQAMNIPRSQRTEYNVRDSDATLVLKPTDIQNDPGTGWTIQCTRKYKKPCLCIDPYATDAEKSILEWLNETSVKTLNIAGPGERTAPGISHMVHYLLRRILSKIKSEDPYHNLPVNGSND
jgi:hypothetical protein